ncbi:MAG: DUF6259 domain-containing protein [Spirochaetota bacterium]
MFRNYIAFLIFAFCSLAADIPSYLSEASVRNGGFDNGVKEWTAVYSERGEMTTVEDGGPCLSVKTTAANYFFYNNTEIPLTHRRLVVTFRAKGKGPLNFYQLLFDAAKKGVNTPGIMTIAPLSITLTPEWKEYSIALSVGSMGVMMKPYFLLSQAQSELVLDNVSVYYDTRSDDDVHREALKAHATKYVDAPAVRTPRFSGDIIDNDGLLYRITLTKNGDIAGRFAVEGGIAGMTGGRRKHAEAEVAVRIRTNGDDVSYEIKVTPNAGYGVFEVEYPLLVLKPISGAAHDRLIVPNQSGVIIDDPFSAEKSGRGSPHRFGKYIWYGTYGTTAQSMQCVLYENGSDGIMLWAKDGEGYIKDFEVSLNIAASYPGDGIRASVHHYPANTGAARTSWTSPYPVVTTRYHNGWQRAAKIYRDWALTQTWCAGGGILDRVKRGELSAWLANNPFWLIAINENTYDMLAKYTELFPGVEFSVFLTQWQRWPFDTGNPDYFPPKNEEGYRRLISLQKNRMHFFPYMNMIAFDNSFDHDANNNALSKFKASFAQPCSAVLMSSESAASVPHYVNYQEFWGRDGKKTEELKQMLRTAWNGPVDESIITQIRSDWMTIYSYEKEALVKKLTHAWGRDASVIDAIRVKNEFKPLCRADVRWREYFIGLASQNLTGYGTDGQYLDQSSVGGMFACWSTDHGHAPGFGTNHLNGTRAFFTGIHEKNRGKALKGEAICEYFIGAVEEAHCQMPEFHRAKLIPLFQTVYHGYISHMAWDITPPSFANMNDLTAAVSLMLHYGYKIGFATLEPYLKLISPEQERFALPYFKQAVKIMLATMDTFCYGERLADPVVTGSPWHEVSYYQDASGTKTVKAVRPVVEASCWRSLDGKKAMFFVSNSGDKAVTVTLASADIQGGTLADIDGGTVPYSGQCTVTMRPFSLRAFIAGK